MTKRIAIGLTEGFADWECALLMASARNYFGFDVVAASPGGKAVTSMGGLTVIPAAALETITPADYDALVLCGGTIWETEAAPDTAGQIRSFHDAGRPVGAICGATLALARAGVLDRSGHTSNEAAFLATAPQYRGQALYRDQPQAVRDGNIVTAPGTAPVTFAAEIYRALGFHSPDLEHYVKLYGREHG
ncbi:putative intracellular protease/amidase [Mycoplana sp. BE70]|uniref:type 1 glutamine amidotransferase family protein n=1 Tax=Mycoplana sp. BE70 TaxID=2817775 RepID=UPI002866DCAE|nr:type 1 glutamine amidotransferase family protein [Mycoplana sp. BE70]MDR6756015.1 putative intracellular protease/amidase [Mycoplana sp. BE70]